MTWSPGSFHGDGRPLFLLLNLPLIESLRWLAHRAVEQLLDNLDAHVAHFLHEDRTRLISVKPQKHENCGQVVSLVVCHGWTSIPAAFRNGPGISLDVPQYSAFSILSKLMVNYYGFVGFLPILHQSYSVYRGNMNFKLSKLKRLAENRYCVRREGSNQLLASFKGPIENAEAALENERSFIEFFGRRPAPLTRKVRFDELAAWREIESDPETLNAYRMAAGFVDRATAAHDIKIEKLAAWSAQLAQLSERLGSLYRSNFQRKVSHLRLVQCVEMEEAMIELSRYVSLVNQASLAKLTESIVNE